MSKEGSSEQKPSTTTVSSVAVQAGDASIVIAVLKVRMQLLACLLLALCYSVITTFFNAAQCTHVAKIYRLLEARNSSYPIKK